MSAVAADLPRTLAEFAAAPDGLLAHLKASGEGRRLQAGEQAVVVMDEDAFRRLLRKEVRASVLEGVLDVAEGRTMEAAEFFAQLRREQGQP
jgi:hypothetical protein